jgi:uncharacterized protein
MLVFLPGRHMSKREERLKRFVPVLIAMLVVDTTKLFPATVKGSAQLPVPPNFLWLKLGEVMPSGWIKAQMERDLREGFAGRRDQLASKARSDVFGSGRIAPGKPNPHPEGIGHPWWTAETEGNWRTGCIMMAYMSGDAEANCKADAYVTHILQTQDEDGYLGAYSPELRYAQEPVNGELWAQTCLLRGLLAYYELTGKREALQAVEGAVRCTMSKYGPGKLTVFGLLGAGPKGDLQRMRHCA